MAVHPAIREHVETYLANAEFALRVVSHTGCVQNTPALEHVKAALAEVGQARAWVRQGLPVNPIELNPFRAPLRKRLPLPPKQHLGIRST